MSYPIIKSTVIALVILFTGCSQPENKTQLQKPDFKKETLTQSIQPGDDFFRYVNTNWMDSNPIPDDKSRFGWFDILLENNRNKLKTLFAEAAKGSKEKGSVAQKIGDFYASGMDTLAIEKEGLANIQFILDQITQINSPIELAKTIGYMHSLQLNPLFYYYASADEKNSTINIAGIYQGGLGLPDRDYYLEDDDASIEIRAAYHAYLEKVLSFSGEDEASSEVNAKQIITFEKLLAEASYTRLKNRDPHLTYNKIKGEELNTEYPGINWNAYFEGLGHETPKEVNVNQTAYLKELENLISNQDLNTWKSYLKALTIRSLSAYLSSSYVNAHFELYGKVIQGKEMMEPRWKLVQGVTGNALGEAVGQLFVERYFPPEAKQRMEVLVENLRIGFAQRIDQLEWMSADTKIAAKDKLNAIKVKIGYPNKWRDYSGLDIEPNSYVSNVLASNRFDFAYSMNKIGKPVDTEEWHMFPQMVNAYYSPTGNEVVFPAAILQPPFFYLDGDDAVNYGAIGVVIGHEMTHGFDDQGAKYDKHGNLSTWWTAEDSAKFATRTQVLVEQFNQYQIKDTVYANGELTLGENIADLGGLNISYAAYQTAIKDKGDIVDIDGLNHKQRFMISYANIWAQNIRDKEKLRRTKTDVHSLGEFRVNGALRNFDAFYKTYELTENSQMFLNKESRVNIW
ncbi:M13 family metallopeptidase [Labilibacter marinus]|uniref:M13 family metallopeptidase n=1 Tax=Labilibacter marinus TaxID=1477105 RepID=UPI00082A5263|nr:M13 family metallopeptidase [Labilibacter marinus]